MTREYAPIDCGEKTETKIEDPLITESYTDGTKTVIADGGTDVIRDADEVRQSDDEVRYCKADGYLYAYREDDEHVVVSRGNEPQTRWTKRVPAKREAVLDGEHLWTIPENWRHRLNIKSSGHARYAVYNIPETGVDVLVSVPNKTRLVDAWYNIKRVGTFNVTFDSEVAWGELEDTIETIRGIEEISDEAVAALETLRSRHRSFERKYVEEVNMYAEDAVLVDGGTPTVKQWTSTPWIEVFHIDRLVQRFLDVDNETRDSVVHMLFENDILPRYPPVRVDVEEGKGVPKGYEIRALVEAGASGAETIDYLITEQYDLMTQTDWSEIRDEELNGIRKHVTDAQKLLSD